MADWQREEVCQGYECCDCGAREGKHGDKCQADRQPRELQPPIPPLHLDPNSLDVLTNWSAI